MTKGPNPLEAQRPSGGGKLGEDLRPVRDPEPAGKRDKTENGQDRQQPVAAPGGGFPIDR